MAAPKRPSRGSERRFGADYEAALELRERRKRAGAILVQRREPKVRVHGDEIEIEIIDNNNSPSRLLVAEFMVLNNFVAASYAAERRIPIIYRVQPAAGDSGAVRARLSVYPEYHAERGCNVTRNSARLSGVTPTWYCSANW